MKSPGKILQNLVKCCPLNPMEEVLVHHFLDIESLSVQQITQLIERALYLKRERNFPSYPDQTLATLFYEPSTRTRVSFQLAANRLGMNTVNIEQHFSSETKGELISDTIKTLSAMGITLFVIRHQQTGLPQDIAIQCGNSVHIINAGDGTHAHPTQAMLDVMTILEHKSDLKALKIAIIGNIYHSRVAKSLQCLLAKLGASQVMLVAPPIWQTDEVTFGQVTASLEEGIADADVIVCLRVQKERLSDEKTMDLKRFTSDYGITADRLKQAKPDVLLMHPGPVNRGIEVNSDLVDGAHSAIWQQVENGVFMRMAILEAMLLENV